MGDEDYLRSFEIGAPNGNYYKGTIEDVPNLEWKGIIPFTSLMTKKSGLPASLTNAAAVGETMYVQLRHERFYYDYSWHWSRKQYCVANGELIYEHDGFGGELKSYHHYFKWKVTP